MLQCYTHKTFLLFADFSVGRIYFLTKKIHNIPTYLVLTTYIDSYMCSYKDYDSEETGEHVSAVQKLCKVYFPEFPVNVELAC